MTDYKEKLMEYECRRVELLCKNPHLQKIQNKIDAALKRAGNESLNRCIVMNTMMLEEAGILLDLVDELINDCNKLKEETL